MPQKKIKIMAKDIMEVQRISKANGGRKVGKSPLSKYANAYTEENSLPTTDGFVLNLSLCDLTEAAFNGNPYLQVAVPCEQDGNERIIRFSLRHLYAAKFAYTEGSKPGKDDIVRPDGPVAQAINAAVFEGQNVETLENTLKAMGRVECDSCAPITIARFVDGKPDYVSKGKDDCVWSFKLVATETPVVVVPDGGEGENGGEGGEGGNANNASEGRRGRR